MHLSQVKQKSVKFGLIRLHLVVKSIKWKLDFFFQVKDIFNQTLAQIYVPLYVVQRHLRCNFSWFDSLVVFYGTQLEVLGLALCRC